MVDRYLWGKYSLYWADAHLNVHGEDIWYPKLTWERLEGIFEAARSHLDFLPIAYYPFIWYEKNGLIIESCGHRDKFLDEWRLIQEAVAKMNNPGNFVTFLGYEWHGNRRRYGDHNVYYLGDYEPLDASETLPELYDNLREIGGIAIPHHTGYQVGERGKDWDFHDDELSPFVEIYSAHGSSEGCDTPFTLNRNMNMGPRVSGGTVLEGLERGYRLGITASGDNHRDFAGVWGNGLMAVYAEELTRESIWDAFMNRHIYGVTGDRIKLKFTTNGHMMGERFKSKKPVEIKVEVEGSHAIDKVEIVKNGRIAYVYCHQGLWNTPPSGRDVRVKLRVECGWGPQERYGVKGVAKLWDCFLEVVDGRLLSVEPCFTDFGQKTVSISENTCNWLFTTKPKAIQGLVFELESHSRGRINLELNSKASSFILEELLKKSRIIALREDSVKMILEQFNLSPEDVENPDIYWHHAYKAKIHIAVPQEAYHVKLSYTDNNPREGINYYYARVTQVNGQMAWSSPCWVEIS